MADLVMKASTELTAVVPEFWSALWYPTLLQELPFNDLISKDWEGEIASLGDTVNVTHFPQFAVAQNIAEDERVDADAITAENLQLVINKQTAKDFIVTKKAMVQSLDVMEQLRSHAMYAIMKKMQKDIIAAIVPNASAPDHSIAYDSGTTLALADLIEAKDLLDAQSVPDDGSRALVTGSAEYNDLFNITGFVSKDFIPAGSPLSEGAINLPVLGFKVRKTTEVGTTSYLFHPMFMTMAVQQAPEVGVYDLGVDGKRGTRVNMDVLWGLKQLDGLRVVSIG